MKEIGPAFGAAFDGQELANGRRLSYASFRYGLEAIETRQDAKLFAKGRGDMDGINLLVWSV